MEKFPHREQAAFTKERLELANYSQKGDEVDRSHAALDDEPGEYEVAKVVVQRQHRSFKSDWMRMGVVERLRNLQWIPAVAAQGVLELHPWNS